MGASTPLPRRHLSAANCGFYAGFGTSRRLILGFFQGIDLAAEIADAVPAAVLRQILEHERRMMPAGMRAHLDELMREAERWRERQSRPAGMAAEPAPVPPDEHKAPAATNATRPKSASATSVAKSLPWKSPRIKRRLVPRRAA